SCFRPVSTPAQNSIGAVAQNSVGADTQATNLLPRDRNNDWYIAEEIGTRIIAKFSRAGKIEKVQGTRLWRWKAEIEREGGK
ncbi:hypothetical protein SB783_32180, partial [Paraburkholderia sp. SIMBA_009]